MFCFSHVYSCSWVLLGGGSIWVIYTYRVISGNSFLFLYYVPAFMPTLAILITTVLGYILNSDSRKHPDLFG